MFGNYPSVYHLGHKALARLLEGPVLVEEKVDGSQFSFAVDPHTGLLHCRSKRLEQSLDYPDALFDTAVEVAKQLAPRLHPGWVYRTEYLRAPRHNALTYHRIPARHLLLFDVEVGLSNFLHAQDKAQEAARLGLETPQVLHEGVLNNPLKTLKEWLSTPSALGGRLEGVVVKNYAVFGEDHKILIGKFVSEAFKEQNRVVFTQEGPTDFLTRLAQAYRTTARWEKAVQHLREAGQLHDEPRDIGPIIKETQEDIQRECKEEIKEILWQWAWPRVQRHVTSGLPEWYKQRLVTRAYGGDTP